jgi:dihydroflavonol-4-reductase
MRVLVTGSAGFLGRRLMAALTAQGEEAVGLDQRPVAADLATHLQGSVLDAAAFERAGPVDAIIHGAALTDLWHPDPSAFTRVNVGGAVLAAEAARRAGARLILIGSYTTLIEKGRKDPKTVTGAEQFAPDRLIGPYAQSKRLAEIEAEKIVPDLITILPTAPIGAGDPGPTPPMRLVQDLVEERLPGMMRGWINIVPVADVAAMTLAALKEGGPGERYLAAGQDKRLAAFAAELASAAGVTPPKLAVPTALARLAALAEEVSAKLTGRAPRATRSGVDLASAPVRFDASKSFEALGLAPSSLDDAIAEAVISLRG